MKTTPIDETHAPALTSWVESANQGLLDFPIQNLPLGVFRTAGSGPGRIGVAIGDSVLDLRACLDRSLLTGMPTRVMAACGDDTLNGLMACPDVERRALRHRVSHLLRAEGAQVTAKPHAADVLLAQGDVRMVLPARITDYTDFYASIDHAMNVGSMMRPDNPLLPNYKWAPIGYHGRSSSIVVSGTTVRRPSGQRKGPDDAAPTVGPSHALDYELELGAFVGTGNTQGESIALADADAHLFGLCLLNDWSARDIQSWEYQPLGPFLAKNFSSTISPWVVSMEALAPFRAPLAPRADGDPSPLPYLEAASDRARGGFAITVEVWLRTARMRAADEAAVRITTSSALDLYWTMAQMLAHHTSSGCNMRSGDLLGSGTISGPSRNSGGCLLELTRRGAEPLTLLNGEVRRFLEDGDEVIMTAFAERAGAVRIGFGECRGIVEAAVTC